MPGDVSAWSRVLSTAAHHELAVPRMVTAARGLTHPYATILGIDEATALLGRHAP